MRFSTVKSLLCLASLLAAFSVVSLKPAPAMAQEFATINIQAILRDSAAAKSTKAQIDAKREQYQGELRKIEDKLQKEDQALAEQRSLLSPEALKEKQKEFSAKITEAQKELQEKRLRLDAAYGKALNDIQEAVLEIVEEMAADKGYQVVMPTSQLLYAVPGLDITQTVLAQLDKDLPKVEIDFNAPLPSGK